MMRSFLIATLIAATGPLAIHAQRAAPDTVACGLASARRPAERVADDFTRLLQLTGDVPSRAALIRRGAALPALSCGDDQPLGARWYEPAANAAATLLPVRAVFGYDTDYPRGGNDGPLWSGRGVSGMLSGGADFRYGIVSARIAPAFAYSENQAYAVPQPQVPGLSPFAYPWHGGVIDWPTRPGTEQFRRLDPGQSYLRVDAYGLAAGVSTENVWWGPALYNPLLFSNTAAGFPHVFVGTSRPLDIGIGALDFELLWGRLTESEWFDSDEDNDDRLIAGVVVDFEPVFAPGLYIGLARTYVSTIPPDGFDIDDFFLQPYTGVRHNVADAFAGENQLLSVFARFVAPGAGLEAWAEWGRDDHWDDLEDLVKQPDHSQAYTLGVQKVVVHDESWLRLYGELTHLQSAVTVRSFRPGAIFYSNGSVRQGYTHRGQLLGAAIGPGSDAQIVGADWYARWGRSGLNLQRIRSDDDAYYANFARFYGEHGHDVELTAAIRQLVFIDDFDVEAELSYSHRYNRNFDGLDVADFDALFSESNWGLRLSASWRPHLSWRWPVPEATPARR